MIEYEPRWFGRPVTKPGRLPDSLEPSIPPNTRDPQSAVNRCLSCTKEECFGTCKPEFARPRETKGKITERKIRDLILSGWVNDDSICEELNISKSTLYAAKRRLIERKEIN